MKKIFAILFIVIMTMLGCIIGESLASSSYLSWLSIGGNIGFQEPFILDLAFLELTFGIWCKINVCGVLFLIIGSMLSSKMTKWVKI